MKIGLVCVLLLSFFYLSLSVSSIYSIQQVHVAFTGEPTEMSIMFTVETNRWETISKTKQAQVFANFTVQYSTTDKSFESSTPQDVRFANALYKPYQSSEFYSKDIFEAILTGLPTNTKIYYRIVQEQEKLSTRVFSFTTAPANAQQNNIFPFTFLSYGDHDTNGDSHQIVRDLIQLQSSYRFIIHQGDLPYAWSENKWDDWAKLIEPVAANTPYQVCVGNHEANFNFTSYKSRFTNSTGNRSGSQNIGANLFYSFDFANIHFVALSSEHDYQPGSLQYLWLENDLRKVNRQKTPFVISYAHRPMYSSNQNHGSDVNFRYSIEPLLYKYGVDLALFGHVHAYERTCPVYKNKCIHRGPIHVVAGTAGFELNPFWEEKPVWSAYRETNHGFLRLTMQSMESLKIEFLQYGTLKVKDSFVINKSIH